MNNSKVLINQFKPTIKPLINQQMPTNANKCQEMRRDAKKYNEMPRNQKGSTSCKGSVQVQVFSRPRSTMPQRSNPDFPVMSPHFRHFLVTRCCGNGCKYVNFCTKHPSIPRPHCLQHLVTIEEFEIRPNAICKDFPQHHL